MVQSKRSQHNVSQTTLNNVCNGPGGGIGGVTANSSNHHGQGQQGQQGQQQMMSQACPQLQQPKPCSNTQQQQGNKNNGGHNNNTVGGNNNAHNMLPARTASAPPPLEQGNGNTLGVCQQGGGGGGGNSGNNNTVTASSLSSQGPIYQPYKSGGLNPTGTGVTQQYMNHLPNAIVSSSPNANTTQVSPNHARNYANSSGNSYQQHAQHAQQGGRGGYQPQYTGGPVGGGQHHGRQHMPQGRGGPMMHQNAGGRGRGMGQPGGFVSPHHMPRGGSERNVRNNPNPHYNNQRGHPQQQHQQQYPGMQNQYYSNPNYMGTQSSQQQQQHYMPQMGAPYGGPQHSNLGYQHHSSTGNITSIPSDMTSNAAPVVEKKIRRPIEIIDPKTGQPLALTKEMRERKEKKEATQNLSAEEIAKKIAAPKKSTLRVTTNEFRPMGMPSPTSTTVVPVTSPKMVIPSPTVEDEIHPMVQPTAQAKEKQKTESNDSGFTFGSFSPPDEQMQSPCAVSRDTEVLPKSAPVEQDVGIAAVTKEVNAVVLEVVADTTITNKKVETTIEIEGDDEDDWESNKEIKVILSVTPKNKVEDDNKWAKIIYSLDELMSYKSKCKNLPAVAKLAGSGWDTMETKAGPGGGGGDQRVNRTNSLRGNDRNNNGNNGGPGWERSQNNAQSNRQGGPHREWNRGQEPKRQQGGHKGGRGGGNNPIDDVNMMPDGSGPVKPLEQTQNRWKPIKSTTNLAKSIKLVKSVMNKMTREKFVRLSDQMCKIKMDSLQMVRDVIELIFDKALGEPHFCDMYADLCVKLNKEWKTWHFLRTVQKDDDGDKQWYWTSLSEDDAEVAGPFESLENVLENVDACASDNIVVEPIAAPEKLRLSEIRLRGEQLVKIWSQESEEGTEKLYWSADDMEELAKKIELKGPFDTAEAAKNDGEKSSSFKCILLNSCQEEFHKDNVMEGIETKIASAKARSIANIEDEDGKLVTKTELTELEEERLRIKRRMLGNIRFIGELFKTKLLREQIMHECVLKLLNASLEFDPTSKVHKLYFKEGNVNGNAAIPVPDEENLESLGKLLTTIGKDLELKSALKLDAYCRAMVAMSKDNRIGTRIRFMLKDVLELRQSKWVPRRKELKQKTLDEIRRDAEMDLQKQQQQSKALNAQGGGGYQQGGRNRPQSGGPSRDNRGRGGYNDNRGGGFGGGNFGGNRDNFNNKHGGGGNRSQQQFAPKPQGHSGFASNSSFSSQKVIPQRDSSSGDNVSLAPKGRGFAQSTRKSSYNTGKKNSSSPSPIEKHNSNSPAPTNENSAMILKPSKKLQSACLSIVKKFLIHHSVDEVLESLERISTEECFKSELEALRETIVLSAVFGKTVLSYMVECKDSDRTLLMNLVLELIDKETLKLADMEMAFCSLIKYAPDLKCDIPKLATHFASDFITISQHFNTKTKNNSWTISWFLTKCEYGKRAYPGDTSNWSEIWYNFVDSGLLADIFAHCIIKGNSVTKNLYFPDPNILRVKNICLFSLFPAYKRTMEDLEMWLKRYEFLSLFGLTNAFVLLSKLGTTKYDDLIGWIEKNIPSQSMVDSYFVQHVFLFIVEQSKKSGNKKNKDNLVSNFSSSSTQCCLLLGFCSTQSLQTSFLHACEQVMKVEELKLLLPILVKENIVSKATFRFWKADTNHYVNPTECPTVPSEDVTAYMLRFGDDLSG